MYTLTISEYEYFKEWNRAPFVCCVGYDERTNEKRLHLYATNPHMT